MPTSDQYGIVGQLPSWYGGGSRPAVGCLRADMVIYEVKIC